jgi:predicted membrane protein
MDGRKVLGSILILLGVGFTLQQLNIIDFSSVLSNWWPLFIIIIGLIQIATNSVSKLGGIIIIIIGAMLQLRKLELIDAGLGKFFWPIILILVGIKILTHKTSGGLPNTDDTVNCFAIFSSIVNKNASRNFKGGSITAVFGGAEVDLRNATLSPEGALLDISVAFGGIDIRVPPDWRVVTTGIPIFGGWENKTDSMENLQPEAPVLNVRCLAAFGGIEVKN